MSEQREEEIRNDSRRSRAVQPAFEPGLPPSSVHNQEAAVRLKNSVHREKIMRKFVLLAVLASLAIPGYSVQAFGGRCIFGRCFRSQPNRPINRASAMPARPPQVMGAPYVLAPRPVVIQAPPGYYAKRDRFQVYDWCTRNKCEVVETQTRVHIRPPENFRFLPTETAKEFFKTGIIEPADELIWEDHGQNRDSTWSYIQLVISNDYEVGPVPEEDRDAVITDKIEHWVVGEQGVPLLRLRDPNGKAPTIWLQPDTKAEKVE
jgi:hypothetical protein